MAPRTLETSAADFLPERKTLPALRTAVQGCRGCDLYKNATQAVFGEGRVGAEVMLVGEQPGDQEDLQGRPFVGPAGKVLDKALEAAGIDRDDVYVTNAVKHFKWEPRGKRRIHKKPSGMQIAACRPWFDAEVEAVRPQVIVAMGATAAQALLGPKFKVTQERGKVISTGGIPIVATVHPSSILRAPDSESRHAEMARFIDDLRVVAAQIKQRRRAA
ncbi:MAG: UdgX family uracil-DNA binding protein [Acidobacteria bacterium]|nr:UdgX family uracil-DNA binding protein [Acidobacteriota bacterium]MBV9144401.1 UdgX family uracil-DNA binding protein [Acidobacteriota bacterium]MBV9436813.1 UdgX family uracil-DNA binding protein [Acidobacteriota bacterium]